jgi:lipopolysaccharide/colanic/teichoic acid biosynthesis glycosyltransferase
MKRCLDVSLSLIVLIVMLPVIFIISVLILCFLGRPIFFVQERPGLNGKPFMMFKFRTMSNERDLEGNLLPNAQRLCAFGCLLRSSSLDEVPELINVLRGEMSLVGPRPLLMEYLDLYNDFEIRRHEVTPGVTGYAQVNGRNAVSWHQRFLMDVWYVENQSLKLDLQILVKTVVKVLKRDGISQPGAPTIKRFEGHDDE